VVARSRPGIRPPLAQLLFAHRTWASSTNTSSTPVSAKSSRVVSSDRLAAGCSPRAASTASAVAAMVPPTQKPNTFTCPCR
jgi:hypothetical protein